MIITKMPNILKKKNKGFTLVEILVSVAIIGILVSLSVIASTNVRLKTRDTKRLSDVSSIVNALQAYYDSTKTYPTMIFPGQPIASNGLVFLKSVPSNPFPRTDGGCAGSDYTYVTTTTGYKLTFCIGSNNGDYPKGIVICKNGNCLVQDDCGATVSDLDGNVYPVVQIGTQCWMGKNLKTKLKPDGTCINNVGSAPCADASVEDNAKERACYDNLESNCTTFGALYKWNGAMNLPNSCNFLSSCIVNSVHRGICPDGWHIPSDTEWHILDTYLKDDSNNCDSTRDNRILDECRNAGNKLRLGGGTNFDAQYAGGRDPYGVLFFHLNTGVNYWSTAMNPLSFNEATVRILTSTESGTFRNNRGKTHNFSLRCIKD